MTAMPKWLLHGMGGACAALIAIIEFQHHQHATITGFDGDYCDASGTFDRLFHFPVP